MDSERFSHLVGAIYDCAVNPAHWHDTFAALCAETGMANSNLSLHLPPGGDILLNIATGMSEADQVAQVPYHADLVGLWGDFYETLARPIDTPWVASRLFSQDYIAGNRFVREWAYPRGIIDCVTVVVGRDPGLVGAIGMGRHRDQGLMDDASIAKIQLFLPHLQRAARITGLLEANADALRNFEAVIEAIVSPVIMVREDLSVVLSNRAADEFSATGEVIVVTEGRIASPVPGVERAIQRLIDRVTTGDAAIAGNGLGLPVRTGHDRVHTLHVLPLAHGAARARLATGAVAAIFVSSTAITHNLTVDLLTPLFELTAAEIRVFELISAGRTTKEVAVMLGVAQSTVRTHLLRVFEKTGVKRQADLIRMVHSLSSPATAGAFRLP